MESNGWVFNVGSSMNLQNKDYHDQCGGETWYGWTTNTPVGSAHTVLTGSGQAVVNFGNCYNSGVVTLFLNDEVISSAEGDVKNKVVKFPFSSGGVLKITEHLAIMKLNSLEIKCPGKYYFIT